MQASRAETPALRGKGNELTSKTGRVNGESSVLALRHEVRWRSHCLRRFAGSSQMRG